ncbi:uncharacterized protein PGTG_19321 [Puccinia graminis f. sp. tritici CRL 75-36-700-3]|uniref:Uncharacterized protein n=1 Tax=Puccinia graminis f. sp. tritici (strain CRL 75-36-700-3 / race SCCL) TaxID=418459 RepID=E3L9P9_PUCGT|nr:uncharacterized protein PGTG_19321 [Puccinia graminis f. sp. tritici CRL 75-36-700-3]EFP93274.2 hypothetical protein PGTG_19321 [Puccinia graminis f. sp. tritici CRL 75-36-700-3]
MAVPKNQQLSMATTVSQPVLDPSLLFKISVVQAPNSSEITIVQGQQPTKKLAKPQGKRAANTANNITAHPAANTTNPAAFHRFFFPFVYVSGSIFWGEGGEQIATQLMANLGPAVCAAAPWVRIAGSAVPKCKVFGTRFRDRGEDALSPPQS